MYIVPNNVNLRNLSIQLQTLRVTTTPLETSWKEATYTSLESELRGDKPLLFLLELLLQGILYTPAFSLHKVGIFCSYSWGTDITPDPQGSEYRLS